MSSADLADRLVESVPNVSEGRRPDVVDRLATAIQSTPDVLLLDRTSDPSHNRSVFTLAGPAGAVGDALESLVAQAIRDIDMDAHAGEHPRIGAVDVIPFVPLADTTMDEAVELARAFGARIAERFDLPIYLYAQAARRTDRVKLADVRRGQYEGLKVEIAQNGRQPDFGPARMHPTAGAVAVGARPFLIAWNIDELDRAQVSMNLLDFRTTPLWRAWETVRAEAAEDGVDLFESELIGLAPLAALLDVADHAGAPADAPVEERLAAAATFLRLRDFSPLQALELRLDAARERSAR